MDTEGQERNEGVRVSRKCRSKRVWKEMKEQELRKMKPRSCPTRMLKNGTDNDG